MTCGTALIKIPPASEAAWQTQGRDEQAGAIRHAEFLLSAADLAVQVNGTWTVLFSRWMVSVCGPLTARTEARRCEPVFVCPAS